MFLIIGLGNPGPTYEKTRHNIGFLLIDRLQKELKPQNISKNSFKGELYKQGDILLLKPTTFMNLSGESAIAVKNFYKPEVTIVVHDDLDLKFGALRFKVGGSHGGHNGLKSLDSYIGENYIRVRMGIDRPNSKEEVVKYVLQNFSKEQEVALDNFLDHTSKAIISITQQALEKTREKFTLKG